MELRVKFISIIIVILCRSLSRHLIICPYIVNSYAAQHFYTFFPSFFYFFSFPARLCCESHCSTAVSIQIQYFLEIIRNSFFSLCFLLKCGIFIQNGFFHACPMSMFNGMWRLSELNFSVLKHINQHYTVIEMHYCTKTDIYSIAEKKEIKVDSFHSDIFTSKQKQRKQSKKSETIFL